MKNSYNIRLNRKPLFRILCILLLLYTLVNLFLLIYGLILYGFHDYFFEYLESDFLLRDMAFPLGWAGVFDYILTVLLDIFFSYILFLGAFANKIKVRQDDIFMFFPPRIFHRIYKVNIHSIEAVDYNSPSIADRIKSWNFSKDSLYKVTCYDTEFVIRSKDDEGMQRLMDDINPRNNPRECDEEDFDPRKFTKSEKIFIGIIVAVVFLIIRNIYYYFF